MQPDEPDASSSRPGPVPLPDDARDASPRRGRHHLPRRRIPPRYLVVALILAVTALVPAVLVPLALPDEPGGDRTGDDRDLVAGGSSGTTTSAGATGAVVTVPAATAPATMTPVVTTPAATTPAGTTPTSPVATSPVVTSPVATSPVVTSPVGTSPVVTSPPPTTAGAVPPPPEELVYEAEAGPPAVRLRRAEVVALGDGAGVRFTSRSGQIEFEPQVPTRDRYRVTIVYAVDEDRRLEVSGWRDSERVRLSRTAGCCGSVGVEVWLTPGGDLTIEPSRGDGRLPIIDRIIIAPA